MIRRDLFVVCCQVPKESSRFYCITEHKIGNEKISNETFVPLRLFQDQNNIYNLFSIILNAFQVKYCYSSNILPFKWNVMYHGITSAILFSHFSSFLKQWHNVGYIIIWIIILWGKICNDHVKIFLPLKITSSLLF